MTRRVSAAVVMTAVLLLGGCASDYRVASPTSSMATSSALAAGPATAAAQSPVTTTTTLTPTPFDRGWQRVPLEPADWNGQYAAVSLHVAAQGKPGFVAFGSGGTSAITNETGAYFSRDGLRWLEIPDDRRIFGGADPHASGISGVKSVVAWGSGFVAVGFESILTRLSMGASSAAVWLSPDGLHWSRIGAQDAGLADGYMGAVTVFRGGLIAAGTVGRSTGSAQEPAVFWRSTDGVHWQRQSVDPTFVHADITALVAGGPGLIAAGVTNGPAAESGASIWVSADGTRWTRTVRSPDGAIETLTVGNGLVAFGFDSSIPYSRATWTSSDGGQHWTEASATGLPPDMNFQLSQLGTAAGYYLAAGKVPLSLWMSTDGVAWQQVHDGGAFSIPPPFSADLGVVVQVGRQILVLGGIPIVPPVTHEPMQPVAWVWTPT